MLEFFIAWGIGAFIIFIVCGTLSVIVRVGSLTPSDHDERLSKMFALGALVGLVWPLVLVPGVCYVVYWTLKQAYKALQELAEGRMQ